ncbi:DUF2142 domain-containing protein, partial [Candidatus Igneacidithiobacillus taiwanensis]|uniref:DUF2142 domain-containing protein n=1 Tax=Candidatus Igneacidithiobacillus taiwanensis TaxID=1945924 RepID=UPI002899ADDE
MKDTIKYLNYWLKKNSGVLYVLTVLPTILFQVFFTPAFQTPDSFNNFYRSYQVADGQLIGIKKNGMSGGMINNNMISLASLFNNIPFHYNKKITQNIIIKANTYRWSNGNGKENKYIFSSFSNTSVYPPFAYIPQAAGIDIGRIFNLRLIYTYRLSLILVSLCAIFITFIAIKINSSLTPAIYISASLAMTTCLFAAMETDALIISSGFLLASLIAKKIDGDQKCQYCALYITLLITFIALQRPPYIGLVFLLFIPSFSVSKNYNLMKRIYYSLIPLTAVTTWIIYAKITAWVNIDPSKGSLISHILYIIRNPFNFLLMILRTIETNSYTYYHQMIGVLGWLDAPLPHSYIDITIFVFFITAFLVIRKIKFYDWLGVSAALITSLLFFFISLYADWSPVRTSIIDGIQGRYFLPLIPLSFVILYPLNNFFRAIVKGYQKNISKTDVLQYRSNTLSLFAYLFIYLFFPLLTFFFTINTLLSR